MESNQCTFPGNSDLYGLGIRIGVYTQILSTLVTKHFVPTDAAGNSTANLIFLSALLLALLRSILQSTEFFAVECFVILQLVLMFFFVSTQGMIFVLAEAGAALLDGHFPPAVVRRIPKGAVGGSRYLSELGQAYLDHVPLRSTFHRLLSLAAAVLKFWFWVSGIRELRQVADGCRTYVFLFSPVTVGRPTRAVFLLLSGVYLVYQSLRFLIGVVPWYETPWYKTSWGDWFEDTFDPRSESQRRSQDPSAAAAAPPEYVLVSRKVTGRFLTPTPALF